MAAIPLVAPVADATMRRTRAVGASALGDYWALTKPEVNFLILMATGAGFYLGRRTGSSAFPLLECAHTLFGTALVSSGAATINQYVERHFDARMRRTARRPLAAGRMAPSAALGFGVALSFAGALYLAAAVNSLASVLSVLTATGYLAFYTPLKRRTPLCTLVGAGAGAMPPLIGWAGATGQLSAGAWVLYAVLFLWQFPHFMAIAWLHREDYARAGYLVLPAGRSRDRVMTWQAVPPAVALIPISLLPTFLGDADRAYLLGAVLLGCGFAWYAVRLAVCRTKASARRLLLASILYLPALLVLLMAEQLPPSTGANMRAVRNASAGIARTHTSRIGASEHVLRR